MAPIKLLLAPLRRVIYFPLFQLAVTVMVILWLQADSDNAALGQIYNALDRLVEFTVERCAAIFAVKSFTRAWLTTGFWIGYVYLAGLLILYLARAVIMAAVEFAARHNVFYLRDAIAHDRGIEAYRAWLPLERIRPPHIAQERWEETFAWPANNQPPYPSLAHRVLRVVVTYLVVLLVVAVVLQEFTPFPVFTWLDHAARRLAAGG
ncbi:MAG: hypothetical protein ABSE22_08855 [Xanthobacteraceae bacterium]|jgi:hypothetical protein